MYVRHNENPPKPKVKNKNIIFRPENWKWDDFNDMCSHMKRIVCKVRSDGYCLLNAVKDWLMRCRNFLKVADLLHLKSVIF